MNKASLEADLAAFGASTASVRWLDSSGADNIDYRDLIHGISLNWERTEKVSLSAVIEFEQRPLLYVIRADAMASAPDARTLQLQTLRSKLACRGDRTWLAVITPGQLSIYPVGLSTNLPSPVAISRGDKDAQLFLQDLIGGRREDLQRGAEETSFHDLLFKLVTKASRDLFGCSPLKGKTDPVLSLVGRALFARFLIDRGLMNRKSFPSFEGDFQSCFSSADKAALTCNWQDSTFNGELLPLADKSYRTFFRKLKAEAPEIFTVLSNILYHAPDGQLLIKETWEHVDFAHVPIGLLSEVYEQFAHEHGPAVDSDEPGGVKADEPKKKKKSLADAESIHYTPRTIAAYMLDQAWPALKCKPHEAQLLDPAAGGGVFLGLAYRRLVAEFWRARKRAPTRKELRGILYRQIRGMDINEAALRLAALSLYLTALELDPSPQDFTDMAFDPMIGKDSVLVLVRKPGEHHPNPHILGSLGDSVPAAFKNRFDLVVGNPPWTSWPDGAKGGGLNKAAQAEIRRIANERASMSSTPDKLKAVAASYRNPDRVPDLAFGWKATEWAKAQDGVIALAMHARLLFKRHAYGAAARDALFSAVQVTGVLNGAALRMQKVWPNVHAPWCLVFARNRVPTIDDAFYFISPTVERKLNSSGLMRVDYESASPVSLRALQDQPLLLKTLFRGTPADVEVMQILMSPKTVSLAAYWEQHELKHGIGLQVTAGGKVVSRLKEKPYLSKASEASLEIDASALPKFTRDKVHRDRDPSIYLGPLVIVPKAVNVNKGRKSYLCLSECVYNESFTGFSAAGFQVDGVDQSEDLARHVFLLTQSSFFAYSALMSSAQYGVERDAFLKEDVEEFRIVPYDGSDENAIKEMRSLCRRWVQGQATLEEIDRWACAQYGLRNRHLQTVYDSLAVSGPGSVRADAPPASKQVETFKTELRDFLQQYFDQDCNVSFVPDAPKNGSWLFLDITCGAKHTKPWMDQWATALADQSGATRVTVSLDQGHIGLALLNQSRHWTRTRAYLCGLYLLRSFGSVIGEIAA